MTNDNNNNSTENDSTAIPVEQTTITVEQQTENPTVLQSVPLGKKINFNEKIVFVSKNKISRGT